MNNDAIRNCIKDLQEIDVVVCSASGKIILVLEKYLTAMLEKDGGCTHCDGIGCLACSAKFIEAPASDRLDKVDLRTTDDGSESDSSQNRPDDKHDLTTGDKNTPIADSFKEDEYITIDCIDQTDEPGCMLVGYTEDGTECEQEIFWKP